MRYTIKGGLRLKEQLEEALRQFVQHLDDHKVDELAYLTMYYAPNSQGRRVEFRSDLGEVIEHIQVEPVETRVFRGGGTPVTRVPVEPPDQTQDPETARYSISISRFQKKWDLDLEELAALLDSPAVRISNILAGKPSFMLGRGKRRLALLWEIDSLYDGLNQQIPIGEWLRSDSAMVRFSEERLLDQMIVNGKDALVLMRDAFAAIASKVASGTPFTLGYAFDAILVWENKNDG